MKQSDQQLKWLQMRKVRAMRVNEIRYCCRVDRVKNGTDVKSADGKVDRARI